MAKVSGKYETLFIVDPTLGEEEISALVQKFQSLVEANGTWTRSKIGASAAWRTRSTTCMRVITP